MTTVAIETQAKTPTPSYLAAESMYMDIRKIFLHLEALDLRADADQSGTLFSEMQNVCGAGLEGLLEHCDVTGPHAGALLHAQGYLIAIAALIDIAEKYGGSWVGLHDEYMMQQARESVTWFIREAFSRFGRDSKDAPFKLDPVEA